MIKEIVLRHEAKAVPPKFARGNKLALRGLYYISPFVRDFQNCQELADYFEELAGEKLVPASCFSNVPHVCKEIGSRIKCTANTSGEGMLLATKNIPFKTRASTLGNEA